MPQAQLEHQESGQLNVLHCRDAPLLGSQHIDAADH